MLIGSGFGPRQNRCDTRIGAGEHRGPLVARLGGEPVGEDFPHLAPEPDSRPDRGVTDMTITADDIRCAADKAGPGMPQWRCAASTRRRRARQPSAIRLQLRRGRRRRQPYIAI